MDMKAQMKAKNFLEFGKDLGAILEELLIGNDVAALEANQITHTLQDVLDVVEGLVLGFGENVSILFSECIDVGVVDFNNFKDAIRMIHSHRPAKVLKGVKALAAAVKEVPAELVLCKGAEEDFADLIKAIAAMSNPKSFAMHVGKDIIVNGRDIYKHTKAMAHDFKDKEWKNFGKEIGIVLEEVFIGNKALTNPETQEFLKI